MSKLLEDQSNMQRDRTSSLSLNRSGLFILGSAVAALILQACSSGATAGGDGGAGAGGTDGGRDLGAGDTAPNTAGADGGAAGRADATSDSGAAGAPSPDGGADALPDGDSTDATLDATAERASTSLIRFMTAVSVPGAANLMGAGHTVLPPDPAGPGHEGIFPVLVSLPAGTGRSMTLTNASGLINIDAFGTFPPVGADGFVFSASPLTGPAVGGLSLPTTDRHAFLAGVFLGAAEPAAPAPPPFALSATASTINGLTLGQVFFIGDGLDGAIYNTGDLQTFRIPDGATRLFLGFLEIDYADNTGAITGTLNVSGVAAP